MPCHKARRLQRLGQNEGWKVTVENVPGPCLNPDSLGSNPRSHTAFLTTGKVPALPYRSDGNYYSTKCLRVYVCSSMLP